MRILAFLLFAAAASPLAAAQRNYSVTDFTRVKVEGPFAVTLATNVAPFARATGSPRALDRVSLRVDGRTLIIRVDSSAWGGAADEDSGPVTIAVGTHDLEQATLSGPGSLAIDRVRGLEFALSSFGSGATSIDAVAVDRLRLYAVGPGSTRVAGATKQLDAAINGPGVIDASGLTAKDATLSALGPASLRANVTNSVKLSATGTATVAIEGGAACERKLSGSAVVTGCR
ncbi:MAG: DUF2807 domain-containing protein [Pseudomonadota bacterium]|nr:DUF2807 domain-containing protein [Pseudomonadota bacterium]